MHGRVNVVRMPATCRATWKKIMHKRAKISGHINQLIAEVRKTHIQYKTLWEWFGRQEGGRAGEVLPPAQKNEKKMKSRTHFE